MKELTRILAWLHILVELPSILAIAIILTMGGGATLAGVWHSVKSHVLSADIAAGGFLLITGALLAAALFLCLFPWIYLLKKRAWAWWILIIVYSAVVTAILVPAVWLAITSPDVFKVILPLSSFLFVVPAITLLILLIDHPSHWKKKQTSRRRKKARRKRRRT